MAVRDVVQAAAGVGGGNEYVEDVFNTYLYTGNDSTQTINNGIDLDGEGGLVWIKGRSLAYNNTLTDTERGAGQQLVSNRTDAQAYYNNGLTSFSSTGFSIGAQGQYNLAPETYASWTFRKAPKFFDIVTWTGDGVSGREIPHNLGSVPGCIIVKNLELGTNWIVYHQGANGGVNPEQYSAYLDATNAFMSGGEVVWGDGTTAFAPTSTHFTIYSSNDLNRESSLNTYVAYVFAHNAGGFGDDGEQNVISCGSYTGNSSTTGPVIDLGYEPQWVLIKGATIANSWYLHDNMRGMTYESDTASWLVPNTYAAEVNVTSTDAVMPTATGFQIGAGGGNWNESGNTYIYIAIRRGPMAAPTSGTEVFNTVFRNASSGLPQWNSGFVTDFTITMDRTGSGNTDTVDRLRGPKRLLTHSTGAESNGSPATSWDYMDGRGSTAGSLYDDQFALMFKRAPGFFDVVAYTGDGVIGREIPHSLGVAPELMIVKARNNTGTWPVYSGLNTSYLKLFDTHAIDTAGFWNNTSPTSSVFTVNSHSSVNLNPYTYVAYLFATLAGVSKVGSYTGTGADLNVDCGFSAGARFVLIKRTDTRITVAPTTGWYIWNSLTGIVAGNDPYLLLNSETIEVTNTDYIDPLSSGFTVTSSAPAALNASGGSYLFLAIA
jgi:hypothetical protein